MTIPQSQSFTLSANGLVDKILSNCWVRAFRGGPAESGPEVSTPASVAGLEEFSALWDTGASRSYISKKVVDHCGLQPDGTVDILTRRGNYASECYLVDLWISENIVVRPLLVGRLEIAGVDVVIGMDVILQGDLAISHFDGNTMLSFRVPSLGELDFVEEQDRRAIGVKPR